MTTERHQGADDQPRHGGGGGEHRIAVSVLPNKEAIVSALFDRYLELDLNRSAAIANLRQVALLRAA